MSEREEEDLRETLRTFWETVKEMRRAQVRYFQNRTRENLQRAMEKEKETDDRIRELAPSFETQARLF